MAVPKPKLTEFGIHYRLESCERDTRTRSQLCSARLQDLKTKLSSTDANLDCVLAIIRN